MLNPQTQFIHIISDCCPEDKRNINRCGVYNWKSRFEAGDDAALEKLKSHAPKQPRRTPDSICEQIILMRQHHPDWGKRRIAVELKKSNGWVALVSPNTVRRILIEAGMWEPPATKKTRIGGAHGRDARSNG